MVICLGWRSPATSRGLPAARRRDASRRLRRGRSGPDLAAYLALHQLGVAVPPLLPGTRWALTPPFHPYLALRQGGLFSVALSVALRRPGVTWQLALGARTFLEPATKADPRPSHSAIQS